MFLHFSFVCTCTCILIHTYIDTDTHMCILSFYPCTYVQFLGFFCCLRNKLPERGLADIREVEAALAAVLALRPSEVWSSCLFFSARLLHTFPLCVQLMCAAYQGFISHFDGLLSILVFYGPKISSLSGKPRYLIMWMQEFFFLPCLLCFHFQVWLNSIKASQWKNVFW